MFFSHIVGSFHTSISSFSTLFPMLGAFVVGPNLRSEKASTKQPWLLWTAMIALGAFLFGRALLIGSSITLGIPTFFATLNWSAESSKKKFLQIFLQIIIPLACMTLFIIHPTGNQAWIYSMYWLIPVLLFIAQRFFGYHSIFSTALRSTFIAHALGAIIWLYTGRLEAATWVALIPRVAVERFVFALVSTIVYYGIQKTYTLFIHLFGKQQTNLENRL